MVIEEEPSTNILNEGESGGVHYNIIVIHAKPPNIRIYTLSRDIKP